MESENLNESAKDFKNNENLNNMNISKSIAKIQEEQKQERIRNKKLKENLKDLLNELFILPEIRSKANRLLDHAVENAMKELSTKPIRKLDYTGDSTKLENNEEVAIDAQANENDEETDQIEVDSESVEYNSDNPTEEFEEL